MQQLEGIDQQLLENLFIRKWSIGEFYLLFGVGPKSKHTA
jgi:tRNA G37 N-methylase TrmD